MAEQDCELCANPGGQRLYADTFLRVVAIDDPHYPGFCRVILNEHVAEMTDLEPADLQRLMNAVWLVEKAVRRFCQPDKVNLASFGNMVPHLHWHVIPRWRDDRHFPNPVWGEVQRPAAVRQPVDLAAMGKAITVAITSSLLV